MIKDLFYSLVIMAGITVAFFVVCAIVPVIMSLFGVNV